MKLVIDSDRAPSSAVGSFFGAPTHCAGWYRLPVECEIQAQTNWCWAAIAASVRRYYGGTELTQHQIADAIDDGRNLEARLDHALKFAECFGHWSPGKPMFDRIRFEISAGRPLAARIAWNVGGGHYVLITGYHDDGHLNIADPTTGPAVIPYKNFPDTYRSNGGWTETFWSRPPAPRSAQ